MEEHLSQHLSGFTGILTDVITGYNRRIAAVAHGTSLARPRAPNPLRGARSPTCATNRSEMAETSEGINGSAISICIN